MLSNRDYPLSPDCDALCADKCIATKFHNAPAALSTTCYPQVFKSYADAEKKSKSHPAFKKYLKTVAKLEASENKARKKNGQEPISFAVSSVYDTNAFSLEAYEDGIHLVMRHWDKAPAYPAGCDLTDIMRRRKRFTTRREVANYYGASSRLEYIAIPQDHPRYSDIVKKFDGSPALSVTNSITYLRAYIIPKGLPVLRTLRGFNPETLRFARSELDAQKIAAGPVIVSSAFLTKRWKRKSTVLKNHAHILSHDWAYLAQDRDGSWGTKINFWKINTDSLALSLEERVSLEERLVRPLQSSAKQDKLSFGLFSKHLDLSLHPLDDIIDDEGSGRVMGK